MTQKSKRIEKIKSFLRLQSFPATITEIHEALVKRMHLDVSRKTVERDMVYLVDQEVVSAQKGIPSRFVLNRPKEFIVSLKHAEVIQIIECMPLESDLIKRLRSLVE